MRSNSRMLALVVMAILLTGNLHGTDRKHDVEHAVPATPLNIVLSCRQTTPEDILVVFENIDSTTIRFSSDRNVRGDFLLELRDDLGNLIPTKYDAVSQESHLPRSFSTEILLLQPGEKDTVTLHLPDLYVMRNTGEYSFKATRKLKSNSPPDDEVSCPAITVSLHTSN